MTRRHIHYEAAFEDYLRSEGTAYVAVDEQRRAVFAGASVKSFDFLIYREPGETWLVDVKGRKFPYEIDRQKRYWENWLTDEDLAGLCRWETVFGRGFRSIVVFAYILLGSSNRQPTRHVHPFGDHYYAFMAIPADTYAAHARRRSSRWGTRSMPVRQFRSLAQPIQECGRQAPPHWSPAQTG
ncbi:MAG: HYExAFE family protein [Phycisphaerales bacterium]|nr:HYExAFE family protein [Phycisphaerales bacterium]